MRYYVTYKIDARYVAAIDADSLEEAREKANDDFLNADFGAATDIDGNDIVVEDEHGNFVWER